MARVLVYCGLFICALLVIADAKLDVTIITPNSTDTTTYFAAPLRFRNNNFQTIDPVIGPGQYLVTSDLDESSVISDLTGQIALIEFTFKRRIVWSYVVDAQEKGAIGVIMSYSQFFADSPGAMLYYEWDMGLNSDQIKIPIVEVNYTTWTQIATLASQMQIDPTINWTFNFDYSDPNPWEEEMHSGWLIAFSVVLGACGLVIAVLAIIEMVTFIRAEGGMVASVQIVSLVSIIFGSLWRGVYCAMSPFVSRWVYQADYEDIFLSTNIPFTICPIFLVSLYQHELLTGKLKTDVNKFLGKLKVTFFIIVGLVFAMEITLSILRSMTIGGVAVVIANIIIYVAICFAFFVLFIVTSVRLLIQVDRLSTNKVEKRASPIRRLVIWMIASSLAMAYLIVSLLFLVLVGNNSPRDWTGTWFNIYLALYAVSLSHVVLYMMRNRSAFGSSGSSASHLSKETDMVVTDHTNTTRFNEPFLCSEQLTTMLQLYTHPLSQPSRAVEWLLKSNNIQYEAKVVDLASGQHRTEAYLKVNPNGRIPLLVDGDFILFESNAIMQYIAEKFGLNQMYPTDLKQRAKVNQWLNWHHINVRQTVMPQTFYRFFAKMLVGPNVDCETPLKEKTADMVKALTVLESELKPNEFLVGTSVTIADLALGSEILQLRDLELHDLKAHPKIEAWLAKLSQLPFYTELFAPLHGFKASDGYKAVMNK